MSDFTITVVTRPAIRCAGLKIRTNMAKASQDCPDLWMKTFGPRAAEVTPNPEFAGEAYSASIMLDSDTFDYWAVIPLAPGADAPAGMDSIEIPGGLYAECHLKSVEELGDAYSYVYLAWGQEQKQYALNMQGASLEKYTDEYMKNGSLTLLCPLIEK